MFLSLQNTRYNVWPQIKHCYLTFSHTKCHNKCFRKFSITDRYWPVYRDIFFLINNCIFKIPKCLVSRQLQCNYYCGFHKYMLWNYRVGSLIFGSTRLNLKLPLITVAYIWLMCRFGGWLQCKKILYSDGMYIMNLIHVLCFLSCSELIIAGKPGSSCIANISFTMVYSFFAFVYIISMSEAEIMMAFLPDVLPRVSLHSSTIFPEILNI